MTAAVRVNHVFEPEPSAIIVDGPSLRRLADAADPGADGLTPRLVYRAVGAWLGRIVTGFAFGVGFWFAGQVVR